MEKNLFTGESPLTIKQNLEAMAYKVKDNETYMQPLSDEERSAHRAILTDAIIKIDVINDEIKAFRDMKKAEKKEHEQALKVSKAAVKTGQIEVTGNLYLIDDQDNRVMNIYNESGEFVSSRPLLPDERQTSLMSASRNIAANDY